MSPKSSYAAVLTICTFFSVHGRKSLMILRDLTISLELVTPEIPLNPRDNNIPLKVVDLARLGSPNVGQHNFSMGTTPGLSLYDT